jgi:hypothetical protein
MGQRNCIIHVNLILGSVKMFIGYIAPDGYAYDKWDGVAIIDKIAKGHLGILSPTMNLIMEDNEKLLIQEMDDTLVMGNRWSNKNFQQLFDGRMGLGNVFITNKRIIFIREPVGYKKHLEKSSPTLYLSIPDLLRTKEARDKHLKEFCQFRFIHTVKIEKPNAELFWVDILFEGKKYRAWIKKRTWLNVIKKELHPKLTKKEQKGFRKKYDVLWYVKPESIKKS